tara:strand:- start:1341 stop:1520 length:180 start_codon:yes stop_codon:yes gene_type:complete
MCFIKPLAPKLLRQAKDQKMFGLAFQKRTRNLAKDNMGLALKKETWDKVNDSTNNMGGS